MDLQGLRKSLHGLNEFFEGLCEMPQSLMLGWELNSGTCVPSSERQSGVSVYAYICM